MPRRGLLGVTLLLLAGCQAFPVTYHYVAEEWRSPGAYEAVRAGTCPSGHRPMEGMGPDLFPMADAAADLRWGPGRYALQQVNATYVHANGTVEAGLTYPLGRLVLDVRVGGVVDNDTLASDLDRFARHVHGDARFIQEIQRITDRRAGWREHVRIQDAGHVDLRPLVEALGGWTRLFPDGGREGRAEAEGAVWDLRAEYEATGCALEEGGDYLDLVLRVTDRGTLTITTGRDLSDHAVAERLNATLDRWHLPHPSWGTYEVRRQTLG